jgi:inositol oxygenase
VEFRTSRPSVPAEPPAEAARSGFRDFERARPSVREFYRRNHEGQTVDFVRAKREEYLPPRRLRMGVWQAIDRLSEIVDESDPDLETASQIDHAVQTAEALRRDGAPRWLVLTGFVHDLGKVLCLFGEPQWAVVGDTFPVGCAFSDRVVHADLFAGNPDARHPVYGSEAGIYEPGCGLDRLLLSWGHDEYLYHVLRPYLPEPALALVRYHSFYAWHREGAYARLTGPGDAGPLADVRRFSAYDLYSKRDESVSLAALRPYYDELVSEFLPDALQW